VDGRDLFLASQYVAGLGLLASIWFVPRARSHLAGRDDQAGRLAAASAFGMLLGVISILVGMTPITGVAFQAADEADGALIRAAVDTSNEMIGASKFAFAAALVTGSLAGARSGSIPRWFTWLGFVGATLALVGAASTFSMGTLLEFGSPIEIAGLALPLVWVLVLGALTSRPANTPETLHSERFREMARHGGAG
jgi:hypothetical protein